MQIGSNVLAGSCRWHGYCSRETCLEGFRQQREMSLVTDDTGPATGPQICPLQMIQLLKNLRQVNSIQTVQQMWQQSEAQIRQLHSVDVDSYFQRTTQYFFLKKIGNIFGVTVKQNKKSCCAEFKQHPASCAVSYTRQPLINSHHRVCAIATTKHRKSHLCTLTGVAVSLLQPNYFTVRELQVVLWDRGVLVIHSPMMTQVVVLLKLTV